MVDYADAYAAVKMEYDDYAQRLGFKLNAENETFIDRFFGIEQTDTIYLFNRSKRIMTETFFSFLTDVLDMKRSIHSGMDPEDEFADWL